MVISNENIVSPIYPFTDTNGADKIIKFIKSLLHLKDSKKMH